MRFQSLLNVYGTSWMRHNISKLFMDLDMCGKEYDLFCRIDVADTGIGISETGQAKVFSRFYCSPSVSELEGVGIGLYLNPQILAGQGGYIKVKSSLGDGSVFSLFLPRKA